MNCGCCHCHHHQLVFQPQLLHQTQRLKLKLKLRLKLLSLSRSRSRLGPVLTQAVPVPQSARTGWVVIPPTPSASAAAKTAATAAISKCPIVPPPYLQTTSPRRLFYPRIFLRSG